LFRAQIVGRANDLYVPHLPQRMDLYQSQCTCSVTPVASCCVRTAAMPRLMSPQAKYAIEKTLGRR
jgi:hypothetical protein